MVLEEGGGPRQVEANTQGVAMTTLQAATARQTVTLKISGEKNTYHIFTMPRGMGRVGVKSVKTAQQRENKHVMTSKSEL